MDKDKKPRESEREQARIAWVADNRKALEKLSGKTYSAIGPEGRALIADAREKIGYSSATVNVDIWRTLRRVHKKTSK